MRSVESSIIWCLLDVSVQVNEIAAKNLPPSTATRRGELLGSRRGEREDGSGDVTVLNERSVYGLDNVRIELPVATAGSRALAATIDYTLFLILVLVLSVAAGTLAIAFAEWIPEDGGWLTALLVLGFFALDFGYFFVQELVLRGQTVGKRLLHLRVVSERGGRPRAFSYVLRNLIRSLDVLFGAWFLVLDPRARRLGDRLAGTLVVHESRTSSSSNAVHRAPAGWGPDRIAVVESLLQRYETLPPDRCEQLAHRILEQAESSQAGFVDTSGTSWMLRLMRSFGEEMPSGDPPAAGASTP